MSAVRKFRPKLALTAMMKKAGDISASEALRRADEALHAMEDVCLNAVDVELAGLEQELRTAPQPLEQMYKRGSDIIGLCGGLSAEGLDVAAHSLCDYIDRVLEGEALDVRILGVHVASMRLLHRSQADSAARQEILAGLAKVCAKRA